MKPQKQTRSGPDGDCIRAVIASLLELPIDQVPDWVKQAEHLMMPEGFEWDYMQRWLDETYGLFLLEIQLVSNLPWNPIPKPAFCIFFGKTKAGVKHAVVGACDQQSFMLLFNPDPSAELDGVDSIAFLVPRDPKLRI